MASTSPLIIPFILMGFFQRFRQIKQQSEQEEHSEAADEKKELDSQGGLARYSFHTFATKCLGRRRGGEHRSFSLEP